MSGINQEELASSFQGAGKSTMVLSVLVPVYNESRTLRTIIDRLLSAPLPIALEIIIVDDASKDSSPDIIRELAAAEPRIKAVFHPVNQGKAGAIHTAISHITGDIAIIQDADLEYDPNDIARIIQPILKGQADAVFGSRFATSEYRRVLYFWHSLANQVLTLVSNLVCDLNLTDMETCYKAIRSDILKQLPLKCTGFGIEPELTVRLAQWGARIYEVPISYSGRTYAEGKKITWRDAIQAFWVLFWAAFLDRRFTTHEGFYVMKAVRGPGLNRWMYQQFSDYVGQDILEAGCGIGNLTEYMLDRQKITCVDIDPLYVETLSRRYGHLENFHCFRMDLADFSEKQIAPDSIDSVMCLNVLEHIQEDRKVLENFRFCLRVGGYVILVVPQHPWLYTPIDKTVGHRRRYRKSEIKSMLEDSGYEVVSVRDFNKFGVFGWFLNGKILGRAHLSSFQMGLFNVLMPLAKIIEVLPLPALSLIAIGVKRS